MTESSIRDTFDGAEYVEFVEHAPVFVVWNGGTTFNVYTLDPARGPPIHNVDVFSYSDAEGKPPDRETAKQAISDHLERVEDDLRAE